jgi:hypothetical protein
MQQNPYNNSIPTTPNSSTKNVVLASIPTRPITQFDLSMRRKVEILKYASNRVSTQTNNQTKSQRWTQIVSRNNMYDPSHNSAIYNRISVCPEKPTPTSGCNVPGNIISLFQNNDVPLYNYSARTDSYAEYPPIVQANWTSANVENIPILSSVTSMNKSFAEIYIQNTNNSVYIYQLVTPLAFYFVGDLSGHATIHLTITDLVLNVCYDGNVIKQLPPENTGFSFQIDLSNTSNADLAFESGIFLDNYIWNNIELHNNGNFVYTFYITGSYNYPINVDTPSQINIDNIINPPILFSNYDDTPTYIIPTTTYTNNPLQLSINPTKRYNPYYIHCYNG